MKNHISFERVSAVVASAWLAVATLLAADKLLVVGDATWGGWSLDRTSVMIPDSNGGDVFRYTGWLEADKEFKFLAQAAWDQEEYRNASDDAYDISRLAYSRAGSVPDYKFKVKESANYDVTCDLGSMTVSVVKSEYQQKPVHHGAVADRCRPRFRPLADFARSEGRLELELHAHVGLGRLSRDSRGDVLGHG